MPPERYRVTVREFDPEKPWNSSSYTVEYDADSPEQAERVALSEAEDNRDLGYYPEGFAFEVTAMVNLVTGDEYTGKGYGE